MLVLDEADEMLNKGELQYLVSLINTMYTSLLAFCVCGEAGGYINYWFGQVKIQ